MRLLMALLLSITNPAFAQRGELPIVMKNALQTKVVASGNFEDFRIDSDQDGKIDLWVIKNGPTRVFVRFKNGEASSMSFRRATADSIKEAQYDLSGVKWILSSSITRQPLEMNGTGGNPTCEEKNNKVLGDLAKFTENLESKQIAQAAEQAVQCEDEDLRVKIESALFGIMNNDALADCIKNTAVQTALPKAEPVELLYFSNKLKLDLKRISSLQEGKGLITCQVAQEGQTEPKGKYIENGNIALTIPKDMDQNQLSKQLRPLIYHELLHRAGITDEVTTDKIVEVCNSGKRSGSAVVSRSLIWNKRNAESASNKVKSAKANVANEMKQAKVKSPSRSVASTAMETGGGDADYSMAKEISAAEVQQSVPSSSSLASSNRAVDEYASLNASQKQAAPVLAMADRAMGVMNTPALASTDDSSTSSSSSPRVSSGERYQSRHGRYESKSASDSSKESDPSKNAYIPSNTKGMRVVEEVDLTKTSSRGAERVAASAASGNTRMVASTGRGTMATQDVPPAPNTDSETGQGYASAGGSGSGASLGSGSGTYYSAGEQRKTNANTRRGVASNNNAVSTAAREEIFSDFSGTSYSEMKSKLRSGEYRDKLVQSQVKIIDTYGGRIGADEARTVYLDDGTQFIMQRRK
ncbi:hypothetical protein [Bdellovibrio sp. HCB274]|uniref:hypothetical protein n=1 Tax=Bdellovibrio sp. HCB274 TaxID=3394361 RepID=UPI0039B63C02